MCYAHLSRKQSRLIYFRLWEVCLQKVRFYRPKTDLISKLKVAENWIRNVKQQEEMQSQF